MAITRELASEGVQVTLVARNEERLKEIIASLPGESHRHLKADLSTQNDIDKLATHISGQNYDLLINNAGVGIYGRFEELPLEQQSKMLALNVHALMSLSYAFLKQARAGNALVNIASVLGFSSFPGGAAYAGTKGFVIRFSESLWYEFKDKGIHVMAFCPGVTATNFYKASGGSEEQYPKIIVQTPEQVAKAAVKALKKRKKPVTISGFMNRSMVMLQLFLSRKQVVKMMGGFSPVK